MDKAKLILCVVFAVITTVVGMLSIIMANYLFLDKYLPAFNNRTSDKFAGCLALSAVFTFIEVIFLVISGMIIIRLYD